MEEKRSKKVVARNQNDFTLIRVMANNTANNTRQIPATLNETDAAAYLGISVSFLRFSRMAKPRNSGPPYCKLGKSVRYRIADLDAWLDSHQVTVMDHVREINRSFEQIARAIGE